jgi:hypothetical protein
MDQMTHEAHGPQADLEFAELSPERERKAAVLFSLLRTSLVASST